MTFYMNKFLFVLFRIYYIISEGGVYGEWRRGSCIAKEGHVWRRGACMAKKGGGRVCAWQEGMHGRRGLHGKGGRACRRDGH